MQRCHYRSSLSRLSCLVVTGLLLAACGDSDDPPASPSPVPGTPGSAVVIIENFTATSTGGSGGTFNYRASLRLRETGGASATITGVSLTLTQSTGVTVSRDVPPADAFPSVTLAAGGTLDSNTLSVGGAPIQASQLSVRITFTGANGGTGTVQAGTTITSN
jgi:hypothetical protein